MPAQEEEFELILGNKQLLSLFFLAVVLFAVFFSFGYLVGFGRGQEERAATIAAVEPMEEPSANEVRLPDTLLEEVPVQPAGRLEAKTRPATTQPAAVPSGPAAEAPRKPQASTKKEEKPEPPPPASQSVPKAAPAGSIHLQVAAVRVRADAQTYVKKLQAKGYPVSLYDKGGDGWFRVLVGPFVELDAAKEYQKRLTADGVDSILRRL